MEPKKNIFDLFKENEHKLIEKPAPYVWRRLERKLDNRNKRPGLRPMQGQMGIAAGILLLFTVITIMLLTLSNNEDHSSLAHHPNLVFEELTPSDADQELLKVVQFTRKHQSRLANPVEEGEEKKFILPAISNKIILLDKR